MDIRPCRSGSSSNLPDSLAALSIVFPCLSSISTSLSMMRLKYPRSTLDIDMCVLSVFSSECSMRAVTLRLMGGTLLMATIVSQIVAMSPMVNLNKFLIFLICRGSLCLAYKFNDFG